MAAIQAIIFDMDGVVFDSERTWAMFDRQANELFCTGFEPTTRSVFCGMDENSIRKKLKELLPDLDVAAYREYIINGVHKYEAEHGAALKPGFLQLVARIKQHGIKCALATSSRRERALFLFQKAGLDISALFNAVVCREDVSVAKPDPQIFLTAAQRLNVSPKDCVVLEDSINGIAAAISGGFTPVMVIDLIPPPQEYLAPPYSLVSVTDLFEAEKYMFGDMGATIL